MCFAWGWLNSLLYRKYLRKRNKAAHFYLGVLTLGGTILLDALIYLNLFTWPLLLPWVQTNWTQLATTSPIVAADPNFGKFWTFNPGIMWGVPLGTPVMPDDNLANIYFLILLLCYFTVWREGANLGRVMYGRLTHERGYWYLIRSTKMVQKSKEKLERKKEKATAKTI